MKSDTFSMTIGNKTLDATFNNLASKADGSVLVSMGETAVLVTAVMNKNESGTNYLPLSVEFEEKFYAAGAILGSRFLRREGRPSEAAILAARTIDRTIRPLFDHRLRHEIQIVVSVLALGDEDPDVLGIIGASLALTISDIPWAGPVGAVRLGQSRNDGRIIINPSYTDRKDGNLNFEILACGHQGGINMIEAIANEIRETDVMSVLENAIKVHASLEKFQKEIANTNIKKKRLISISETSPEVESIYQEKFANRLLTIMSEGTFNKENVSELRSNFLEDVADRFSNIETNVLNHFFETKVTETLSLSAIKNNKRADGRDLHSVRELNAQVGGISPALHGSGIFYRGNTHVFTALTLAGPEAAQLIDTIELQESKKHFIHHYNFPPFSVGETGRIGGFNRRMIGHGALAENSLLPVIPTQNDFPYTIRLVSEVMSSNGSSSMASVCAGTLALMDGGVPILRPVAGIAIGLLTHNGDHALLTDIQGPEDEYGDMDLKVAGTELGITAIQMDTKLHRITLNVIEEGLNRALKARLHILNTIKNTIPAPRKNLSPRAPEIVTLKIRPEQIGLVIGAGGKTINSIKENTGVQEITIEEDGTIYITGNNGTSTKARAKIESLTKIYEPGDRAEVVITKVLDFGAFARLDDHHEGLIHISEIAPFRVNDISKLLEVGQQVPVTVTKVEDGKIALSIKQAEPEYFSQK